MRIGIAGLPQSGKTTLFNALTGAHGEVGGYHAGERVNLGIVRVPDDRLGVLAEMFQPKKTVQAQLEVEDVGGVFAHLAGGESSGAAVGALREVDLIVKVLRGFESDYVPDYVGAADPVHACGRMTDELLLADLEVIENRLDAIEHALSRPTSDREALLREQDVLERCRVAVEQQRGILSVEMNEAEQKLLRSYSFLTLKPELCVVNVGEEAIGRPVSAAGLGGETLAICAELEMELMDLEPDERQVFMEDAGLAELAAGKVVRACYGLLGLRSFFTVGPEEVHAWTVRAGDLAPEAAGKVHTDMEKGFIRAEVVHYDDLVELGSLKEARAHGKLRMEGRDYEVLDGDVITFHFSS